MRLEQFEQEFAPEMTFAFGAISSDWEGWCDEYPRERLRVRKGTRPVCRVCDRAMWRGWVTIVTSECIELRPGIWWCYKECDQRQGKRKS